MKKVSLEQFKADCLSVIAHYRADLDYDIDLIKGGKPSLFFAYDSGSHCIRLFMFEEYPNKFERVPYIFGMADREHILSQVGVTIDCESVRNSMLVHWYNGETIFRVSMDNARAIIADYHMSMRHQFNSCNGVMESAA